MPNIGFVLGVAPPALLGLLAGGWGEFIAVVVVYSLLNFVVQTLIQPRFVGDSVGLSMTVTFVALLFWGWVLGALGALLAIPLTLLFKALLVDVDPRGHWLDALLREEPRAPRTMRARRRQHARRAALASVRRLHLPTAVPRTPRNPCRRRRRPAVLSGPFRCTRAVRAVDLARPFVTPSRRFPPCCRASVSPSPTPGSASRCWSWASSSSIC